VCFLLSADKILKKKEVFPHVMTNSNNFLTIIIFSAFAVILSVVATLLPSSGEKKEIKDLKIEYQVEPEFFADHAFSDENVFDFLKLQLSPEKTEPSKKVTRSRQPSSKKIVTTEEPVEGLVVRSSPEFVIQVEDNTALSLQQLSEFVQKEQKIRYDSIKNGEVESCGAIGNSRAEIDCRGEIYFQKAISEKNVEFCEKIKNEELSLRCQNYFNLNIQNVSEN